MDVLTARPAGRGLLFDLLTYAATYPSSGSTQAISALRVEKADDRQMQWISEAGLAPLLYRALRDDIDQIRAIRREMLLSAHLTAVAWQGNLIDATREIIETCAAHGIRLTLLKGMSISDQRYPDPHLRPMGDIDILVPACAKTTVESTFVNLGYRPQAHYQHRKGGHHGAPLFHPRRRVWIEVHTALFPEDANLRSGRLFTPSHVAAQTIASTFQGCPVNRLTDELQLVYIASSWVRDLAGHGIQASFVPALLDAIYLLHDAGHTLDWSELLGCLDNPMAAASLYVMLSYLSENRLCQLKPRVLSRLASSQDVIGAPALWVLHRMVDKYLVEGRPFARFPSHWHVAIVLNTLLAPGPSRRKLASVPWNILFPPSVAERYSVRYQLGRIAKGLRGR
jgi:hypothetical protein